jgi:hypothetical protein
MKKTGIVLALFMGAVLLGAQTAVIREISGTVEVKQPGSPDWEAAKPGQELYPSSLISTGFKSAALLSIGNSNITVRALTRLSLEAILTTQNEAQILLSLRAGRIRANVRPPVGGTSNFTVRSPMATASVRGTIFDFDGVRLQVDEGRVYLAAGAGAAGVDAAGAGATGVYVSAGHEAAATGQAGKIAPAIETIKEALSPSLPAGVQTVPAVVTAPPSNSNLDVGFDWSDQ